MTINETLKGFVERWKSRKRSVKEFEDNEKMVHSFQQKKLSHNERVLNVLLEQNRQQQIKQQLEYEIVKRRNENHQSARNLMGSTNNLWKDNSLMKTKNLFQNNKSILNLRSNNGRI
jgi:hypothetical protein